MEVVLTDISKKLGVKPGHILDKVATLTDGSNKRKVQKLENDLYLNSRRSVTKELEE